jgi:hypothetical protein
VADQPEQKVELEELVSERVPGSIEERGTYLQRVGVKLFFWVLMLTVGILVGLFIYLIASTPYIPDLSYTAVQDTARAETVHLLIEQRKMAFDRFIGGVDRLVLQFCLPLMTGILGYLFGTREPRRTTDP